jgi:hypothetical protein
VGDLGDESLGQKQAAIEKREFDRLIEAIQLAMRTV